MSFEKGQSGGILCGRWLESCNGKSQKIREGRQHVLYSCLCSENSRTVQQTILRKQPGHTWGICMLSQPLYPSHFELLNWNFYYFSALNRKYFPITAWELRVLVDGDPAFAIEGQNLRRRELLCAGLEVKHGKWLADGTLGDCFEWSQQFCNSNEHLTTSHSRSLFIISSTIFLSFQSCRASWQKL